jgi:hypothetical protein
MSMEQRYKMEIELMKESDRIAKQQALQRRVVHTISAGRRGTFTFGGLFSSPKANTPLKSSLGTADKEGWIFKQTSGLLKRWDRRWLMLKDMNLYWFKDNEVKIDFLTFFLLFSQSEDTKGILSLEGANAQTIFVEKRKYTFAVFITSQNRKILMQANSDAEAKEWIDIINENIQKLQIVEEEKF